MGIEVNRKVDLNKVETEVDNLKQAHASLSFVVQKLTVSQFFPEDSLKANSAIQFLTGMAKGISEQIEKLTSVNPEGLTPESGT